MEAAEGRSARGAEGADGAGVPEDHLGHAGRRIQEGIPAMPEPLTDESLMREIDRSVMLWCSDGKPRDAVFHGGVLDPWNPTDEELDLGWINFRNVEAREPKALSEIVFRSVSWDHIPPDQGLREAPAQGIAATGLPNQPFRHFRYIGGRVRTVLLSNWSGSVSRGRFRGAAPGKRMTDSLAEMLMRMVNEEIRRPNWSGYTPREDFTGAALVRLIEGALKFSPMGSAKPRAYLRRIVNNAFVDVVKEAKGSEWAHERRFGNMDLATDDGMDWDGGGDLETFREESDREFEEGERAFREGRK